ncbi:hypothetical protein IWZ03DRAFT_3089 [Phyllosticta citriasiana]|uniref:Uncharacterized protein n=1 Tax=Phyllosticta citriasiana TaxID=595635 RepID=A0ABR1L1I7_9PEZI
MAHVMSQLALLCIDVTQSTRKTVISDDKMVVLALGRPRIQDASTPLDRHFCRTSSVPKTALSLVDQHHAIITMAALNRVAVFVLDDAQKGRLDLLHARDGKIVVVAAAEGHVGAHARYLAQTLNLLGLGHFGHEDGPGPEDDGAGALGLDNAVAVAGEEGVAHAGEAARAEFARHVGQRHEDGDGLGVAALAVGGAAAAAAPPVFDYGARQLVRKGELCLLPVARVVAEDVEHLFAHAQHAGRCDEAGCDARAPRDVLVQIEVFILADAEEGIGEVCADRASVYKLAPVAAAHDYIAMVVVMVGVRHDLVSRHFGGQRRRELWKESDPGGRARHKSYEQPSSRAVRRHADRPWRSGLHVQIVCRPASHTTESKQEFQFRTLQAAGQGFRKTNKPTRRMKEEKRSGQTSALPRGNRKTRLETT